MNARALYAVSFAGLLTVSSVGLIAGLLSLSVAGFGASAGSLVFGALVEGVVFVALTLWLARDLISTKQRLGLVRVPFELLLLGVGLGVALHGPADFVQAWVERLVPLPDAVALERLRRLSPSASFERALLLLAAAGVVPIAEELFFRGALLGWVEKVSTRRLAAWVCALCFTLSHAEPRSFPALGLVAAALGVLRFSSGLVPCILLHATFNATTLAVLFAQPSETLDRSEPSWRLLLVGSALSMALLWRAVRVGAPGVGFAR